MSLSETDKREVCPLHGWVGRRAFQQDRHDLCEAPTDDLPPEDDVAGDPIKADDEDDVHVDDDLEDGDEDEDEDEDGDEDDDGGRVLTLGEEAPRWSRASARRRGIPPKKTLAVRRITQVELASGRAELQAIGADGPYDRPRTRGHCQWCPVCQLVRDGESNGLDRAALRALSRDPVRRDDQKESHVGSSVHVPDGDGVSDTSNLAAERKHDELRLPSSGKRLREVEARDVTDADLSALLSDDQALRGPERHQLQELRRPGNHGMPGVEARLRAVPSGRGASSESEAYVGAQKFERELRRSERRVGDLQAAGAKQKEQSPTHGGRKDEAARGMERADRNRTLDDQGTSSARLGRLACGHRIAEVIHRSRPCVFAACKYSLYLDVSETGSIILNFPHLEPGQMAADRSCALDLAERGPMTLEEIAVVTNLTRERIRQIELKALIRRARPAAEEMGLGPEDAAAAGTRHHVGPGADLEETGIEGAVPSDVATILGSGGGRSSE
jgi:hypothetical protein